MIGFLALCAVADLGLLLLTSGAAAAPPTFALGHLVLTVLALAVSLVRRQRSQEQALMLPIGAAFGPAGIMALLLLGPHLPSFHRKRQLTYRPIRTRRYYGARSVSPAERLARILDERIRYPEADEVGSLAMMLGHGNLQSRYKALEIVVTSFEPRLSSLIGMALSDQDQTIRALAAAAAAQVSYNLTQQRRELEAKLALSDSLDDRHALALLLAEHGCHNQLLPQAQRARLCQEAAGHIREISRTLPSGDRRKRSLRTLEAQVTMEIAHEGGSSKPQRGQALEVAS